jgi:hypothetical protein
MGWSVVSVSGFGHAAHFGLVGFLACRLGIFQVLFPI